MNDYRPLTSEEIEVLKSNDCWAEDWTSVNVAEDFKPNFMHRVMLYGEVNIGAFNKNVEVSQGFVKHAGINNATLRNVTIGDDCLIENVGNFINNYTIGDDCYISNISTMETTEGATYGEGNLVSVLNEVGEGNVILFSDLNSQLAAFMVKHFSDKDLKEKIRQLIKTDIDNKMPERGQIGNNVKIVNTKEITNTIIYDDCEIAGASRLSDCTIMSNPNASVYIGTGVICENSIICDGSSIINSVKMQDCFVGEACQLANGFTASQSVFFANSYMSNGEACAAFCGPFSASPDGVFERLVAEMLHHEGGKLAIEVVEEDDVAVAHLVEYGDEVALAKGGSLGRLHLRDVGDIAVVADSVVVDVVACLLDEAIVADGDIAERGVVDARVFLEAGAYLDVLLHLAQSDVAIEHHAVVKLRCPAFYGYRHPLPVLGPADRGGQHHAQGTRGERQADDDDLQQDRQL